MTKRIPYPDRIPLAQIPTPLIPLDRLSKAIGGTPVWMKRDDLTGIELTGNKARKLEFLLADALAQGCDSLLTYGGIQSNHCRATAALGAKTNLKVYLLIRGEQPEGPPDGNLLLDHLFGADVTHVPSDTFLKEKARLIDETLASMRKAGHKPYYFPVGGSVPVAVWGYVKCLEEIHQQAEKAGLRVRHVVTACGSGGTAAGLALGRALLGWDELTVWAIAVTQTELFWKSDIRNLLTETSEKYELGLRPEDLPFQVTDKYVGEGYAIPYPEEIEVIRRVARTEGILLEPVYTGKAMTGLLDLIRQGRIGKDEAVVFVHTGGVFGLFPQKGEFA